MILNDYNCLIESLGTSRLYVTHKNVFSKRSNHF